MFNTVDRYIARTFLGYFIATLTVVLTLYIVVHALSETLKGSGVSLESLTLYYVYSLPAIAYQFLPVAALTATLFTLSGMNSHNELVALFSSGMSLARVSAPILSMIAIISISFFAVGDWVMPIFNQKKNYIYFVEIKKQPGLYATVKTNRIWYRSGQVIFYLQTVNPEAKSAEGVAFYYMDNNWDLSQVIHANKLVQKGAVWDLNDGAITIFEGRNSFPMTKTFEHKAMDALEKDFFNVPSQAVSTDVMRLGELRSFIKRNKEAGLNTLRYEVDYQAKFGFAFASLVMAFLGVPFSARMNRSGGRAMSIGVTIAMAFGYWSLYSSGLTLGKYGYLPPFIAAWLPNIVTLVLTGFLVLRLRR